MNTINHLPRFAWYQTATNPPTWSLGEWDGYEVTNIQAQVKRDRAQKLWYWTTFLEQSSATASLSHGYDAIFKVARVRAESALQSADSAQQ